GVVAGSDQRRGQPLGIVVDGKAKQHQEHQRYAEHHGEGDAVAPHLDEFLRQQGVQAREREDAGEPHPMLSFAPAMNWMKTSSRLVSPGDTVTPGKASCVEASVACNAALSEPTTCSVMPKGATCSTPALPTSEAATLLSSLPCTMKVFSPAFLTTSSTVPVASSLP